MNGLPAVYKDHMRRKKAEKHVTEERFNPISVLPAEKGWKAIFEVSEGEEIVGVAEVDVVMWAVCEHTSECRIEGQDTPHSTAKHDNFVCGLVSDEFAVGGLQPALAKEGLLGYKPPNEEIETFIARMGVTMAELSETPKPLH